MKSSDEDRARSIRQRLTNAVRARNEDVQFALQRYAMERFLYRLGKSPHRERLVLKGAMLFALWGGSLYRPTRDLDFTGYGGTDTKAFLARIREICEVTPVDDGLLFHAASMQSEPIRDESEYLGMRIRIEATLGRSRIPLPIDVGFGNAIQPPPVDVQFPTLLDDPPPSILAYQQEAVVAEKLHALVVLGERNSRYKDFYDLFVLGSQFPFNGPRLASAIAATFQARSTSIDAERPLGLTPRFHEDSARAEQWRAYLTRNELPGTPAAFEDVGELLRSFLGTLWDALSANHASGKDWPPGGPWG
jgi:predicted nucleotidyltransferase component of viral defense system